MTEGKNLRGGSSSRHRRDEFADGMLAAFIIIVIALMIFTIGFVVGIGVS